MPAVINTARTEALRTAPLDSWIALNGNETEVIATGATYEVVSKLLDESGVEDSLILKTPKTWARFAV
jgi:hypothetical protein